MILLSIGIVIGLLIAVLVKLYTSQYIKTESKVIKYFGAGRAKIIETEEPNKDLLEKLKQENEI